MLVTALVMAAAGCKGDKGPAGSAGSNGGSTGTTTGALGSTGLQVAVKGVKVNADKTVTVNFTMKDDQGNPVDANGVYSVNAPFVPRFSLSQVVTAADGSMLPYNVLTKTGSVTLAATDPAPALSAISLSPNAVTPSLTAPNAVVSGVLEIGANAGEYTYTFPTGGVTPAAVTTGSNAGKTQHSGAAPVQVDPSSTSTHALWIQAARQTNLTNVNDVTTFKAANVEYDFVPGSATATPLKRELVSSAACNACHRGFRPEGSVANGVHGGSRYEAPYCNVCHNVDRKSTATTSDAATPAADSAIFIHRIHSSKEMTLVVTTGTQSVGNAGSTTCSTAKPCDCTKVPCTPNAFHAISEVTYPQDLRNCDACHKGAAQGAQATKTANRAVCGSCHDYVTFDPAQIGSLTACVSPTDGAEAKDANGRWKACVHSGGTNIDDNSCKGCHVAGGSNFTDKLGAAHVAVAPRNDANILVPVTTGQATAGYNVAQVCTVGLPCTCTAVNPCYNPDYVFITSSTVAEGYYSSTGVACTTALPCVCAPTTPCFSNPFSEVTSGGATSGFGVVKANACKTVPCTCSVANPCVGVGSSSTNAAFVAAAGAVPAGAVQISYDLKSVSRNATTKQPEIVFKLQQTVGGTTSDVVFKSFDPNSSTPGQELVNNFVGGPSVYWVFAVPQDGITTPADFNASYSTYVRSIWNNTATTTSAGTMTGPDPSGYYTITLTKTVIPDNAVMLTGGVGYTYSLSTTPPLTQTNVPGYPYDPVSRTGGLVVPARDASKVGTGYTPRRAIVDNAKCNNCHVLLGANPSFHAGQRNDGPTCSFCHNPNQNNAGWAGNTKDFIHGLHAGTLAGVMLPNGTFAGTKQTDGTYQIGSGTGVRTVPYGWHAISKDEGYWEVTFPGQHNYCEACHAAGGTYDFSAAASVAALPNLLSSTNATGKTVAATPTTAPYIAQTAATDYGSGFSVAKDTGIATQAATSTLVSSPITAACVACHDSPAAKGHMVSSGGSFYDTRLNAKAKYEGCLVCHGPGGLAPIADVHR